MKNYLLFALMVFVVSFGRTQSNQRNTGSETLLYLCGISSGGEIESPCNSLSVGQAQISATQKSVFEIISWKYRIPNAEIDGSGTGSEITALSELFEKLGSGETIIIEVIFKDAQGKQKIAEGKWIVKK